MSGIQLMRFACFCAISGMGAALEPMAMLNANAQPVWQAGQPVEVKVDYDVPAFGTTDLIRRLKRASGLEYRVFQRRVIGQASARTGVQGEMEETPPGLA
mmetsp:Transcript_114822/g.225288  ORF Transcript_114822/g.225288 Transcript_114822/m.225288 type:complete len:100 (+) Transcript_114822:35-334(+)